jgi:hypothetical protein
MAAGADRFVPVERQGHNPFIMLLHVGYHGEPEGHANAKRGAVAVRERHASRVFQSDVHG